MAKKKLREFATWRIKWYLLYIAFVLLVIAALVATIIFMDNGTGKILVMIYEIFVIVIAFAFPIAVEVYWRKCSKEELQQISEEEYQQYLKQAKNCNIHAK